MESMSDPQDGRFLERATRDLHAERQFCGAEPDAERQHRTLTDAERRLELQDGKVGDERHLVEARRRFGHGRGDQRVAAFERPLDLPPQTFLAAQSG